VITGGDSGIGKAVAIAYAREGADVLITYLPEEEEDARDTARWVEEAGARRSSSSATSASRRTAARSSPARSRSSAASTSSSATRPTR
jgi:NAD(P)-dependent dehydrogenase (short-subunit alcohol dehydrogenase family)